MKKGAFLPTLYLVLFIGIALLFLVFLPEVFSGKRQLESVALEIFGFEVRWYGIIIGFGALVGYFFILSDALRARMNRDNVESAVLISLVFGLFGARVGFALQNINHFLSFPLEFFNTRAGGLSIHGALICAAIALFVFAKMKKLSFFDLINVVSPPVLLSIAIGRWGNFFNREIIGRPTDLPWKMFVPLSDRPKELISESFFHPVFLYESLALVLIFAIYWLFLRDKKIGFAYTFIGYCVVRIVVEFFRIDYKPIFVYLDLAQIVSFVIILLIAVINFYARRHGKPRTVRS